MPIGVAVIDANLLVPIVACDYLLTAFASGAFEPIVSTTMRIGGRAHSDRRQVDRGQEPQSHQRPRKVP